MKQLLLNTFNKEWALFNNLIAITGQLNTGEKQQATIFSRFWNAIGRCWVEINIFIPDG